MNNQGNPKPEFGKYNLSRFINYIYLILFIFLIPNAAKAITVADVYVTDVTPSSFTVVWIDESNATGNISLYSDVLGVQSVTDAVFQNQFTDSNDISLANQARINGVLRVRVSNLSANTPYFFKLNYTNSGSGTLPISGPLFAVKTRLNNAAVSNEGITIDVLKSDGITPARGTILLAQVAGSPYPVSHLVGDATDDKTAIVNLSNLFLSGINRELAGGEALSITVLGGNMERVQLDTTVPVNNKKGELEIIASGTIQLQSIADSDGDGIPDWYEDLYNLGASDGDADNDTLTDLQEYQLGTDPNAKDTDGDGWNDDREINTEGTSATNADSDLDGIADNEEAASNTDPLNGDSDGDGALDGDELAAGTDPTDILSVPVVDIDSDGAGDIASDNCIGVPNADQADLDNDGIGDACDDDIDGDGILNNVDNAPLNNNPTQIDTDNDGIGDAGDNCSVDYNPTQLDTDGDNLGNECDADDDNDTINDFKPPVQTSDVPYKFTNVLGISGSTLDVIDNPNAAIAIYKYDPDLPEGQQDVLVGIIEMINMQWTAEQLKGSDLSDLRWLAIKMDAYGCSCFNTISGDNFTLLTDTGEIKIYPPRTTKFSNYSDYTRQFNVSTDGSTYSSSYIGQERLASRVKSAFENVPLDNCRIVINTNQSDIDGDGIGDLCDRTDADADGDGILNDDDNCPLESGYNPAQLDFDNDGMGNVCDPDSDNDGLSDVDELLFYTNPLSSDTDGDGIIDSNEDYDFDGILNFIELSNGDNPAIPQGRYKAGLNYFHYPNSVPLNFTAYSLLANLGGESNVVNIQRINASTGLLEKVEYVAGVLQGTDFPITTGQGYFIDAAQDFSKDFTESRACNGINLVQGKNLIGLSCIPSNFDAYSLLEYLGGSSAVNSIQRFNTKTGLFETATYFAGNPVGVNFSIISTESYLVHSKQVAALPSPIFIPSFTVTSFADGAVIDGTTVTISGTVSNADVRVTVNGQRATVNADGTYSITLELPIGANTLTVIADNQGIISVQELNITVQIPPVITVTSHADGQVLNTTNAGIFGVLDKKVVSVTVNGIDAQLYNDGKEFRFGFLCLDVACSNTGYSTIGLNAGLNEITIVATDEKGISGTKILSLVQERLVLNAINPGTTTGMFSVPLPKDILENINGYNLSGPAEIPYNLPWFAEPFDGRLRNQASLGMPITGNIITVPFGIEVNNEISGSYDIKVDIILTNPFGNFTIDHVLVQLNIPVSTAPPTYITDIAPLDGATVFNNPAVISGIVSSSATNVSVDGVQAELYHYPEIAGKRFFAWGMPLVEGLNTLDIEVTGEAYDLGDATAKLNYPFTLNHEVKEIIVGPGKSSDWVVISPFNAFPERMLSSANYCTELACVDVLDDNPDLKVVAASLPVGIGQCSTVISTGRIYFCATLGHEFRIGQKVNSSGKVFYGISDEVVSFFHKRDFKFNIPVRITNVETFNAPNIVLDSPLTVPSTPSRIVINVTNDSTAKVMINGIEAIQDTNYFYSSVIPLEEGDNTVSVVVDGLNGKQSTAEYIINLSSVPPPVVSIISPSEGDVIPDEYLTLISNTSLPEIPLTLSINGVERKYILSTVSGNTLTWPSISSYYLKAGSNLLQIFADGYLSALAEVNLNLVPLPAPVINVLSHIEGETVTSAPITITGNIQNLFTGGVSFHEVPDREWSDDNNNNRYSVERDASISGDTFTINHIDLSPGENKIRIHSKSPGPNGPSVSKILTINYLSSEPLEVVNMATDSSVRIAYEFTVSDELWNEIDKSVYPNIKFNFDGLPDDFNFYSGYIQEKLAGNRVRVWAALYNPHGTEASEYNITAYIDFLKKPYSDIEYIFTEKVNFKLIVDDEEYLYQDTSIHGVEYIQLTEEQDAGVDDVEITESGLPAELDFTVFKDGRVRHDVENYSWEIEYYIFTSTSSSVAPGIYNYAVTYDFKNGVDTVSTKTINKSIEVKASGIPADW